MPRVDLRPLRGRLVRHARRWGPYWVVALALLVMSQMLWRWHTWPVREMLTNTAGWGP